MNIAAGEDPWSEGTVSDPLKKNMKGYGKQHEKRNREYYSSNSWVSEEYQAGYSHKQPD